MLLVALVAHEASAEANRESLVEAWEVHIASLPGTVGFEAVGEGVYQFGDTDLPYREPGPLFASLVFGLGLVGFMFSRLLLRPLWRMIHDQKT